MPPDQDSGTRLLLIAHDPELRLALERLVGQGLRTRIVLECADGLDGAARLPGAWDVCMAAAASADIAEVIGWARSHQPARPLPVVALVRGHDEGSAGLERGAADYLDMAGLNAEGLERSVRHARQIGRLEELSGRELRRNERQLRSIFEASPDPIMILDDEMHLVRINPAAGRALGTGVDSVVGRPLSEFVRTAGRVDDLYRELLQTGRCAGEIEVARADGTSGTFDVGGAFSVMSGCHLVVCHDTTARRDAERRLADSESRLRTLAQTLPQLVWTADPDGNNDFCNRQWTELCGIAPEEAFGRGWFDLLHPEDVERTLVSWQVSCRSGAPYQVEHRLRCRGGEYRWFLTRSVPVRDDGGRVVKWFGSSTDIDEQKRAEQRLAGERAEAENERRRLRAMLDVLPIPVFISDRAGRLTDANPAAASVWGSPAPLSGSLEGYAADYPVYWPGTGRQLRCDERGLYRAVIRGESVTAEEVEFVRADGDRGTALAYAAPVRDGAGNVMGGIAVSVEVTDLKRTQTQLIELNDALEQRVRERTRSLLTYQEHLRAMASELVVTEQRERRRLATELHDYLAQLLVAGKMKSKLVSHYVEPAGAAVMDDLRGLIDEALKYTRTLIADLSPTILYEAGFYTAIHWLGEQMQRHGLQVTIHEQGEAVDLPDDLGVMLFQTIRELLFNVVKHAHVAEATVRMERSGSGELVVTVEDAGPGFDPTRHTAEPADGKFGLFSIRERMVALGGLFEIQSQPGRGTRAVVRIPLGESEPAGPSFLEVASRAPEAAPAGRSGKRIRVLLVDDHEMVREGFRTLIECDPECEVAGEAANGEDAVILARVISPDVVIMDINMPRMNGIEATRRIKQEMPHIAVIGLSVHDDRGLAATMLEAGAVSYLTKGGPAEELGRAIHAAREAQLSGGRERME